MANEKHLEILRQGVVVWNEWRKGQPRLIPRLRGATLAGHDLTGANLTRTDVREANLADANLSGADLTNAGLNSANLSGAELHGTWLVSADLTSANLSRARLTGGADLSWARLQDVDLTGAFLPGAIFIETELRKANFAQAIMWGANLWRADLTGASLAGAELEGASLKEANLTGADLTSADLTSTDLTSADLTSTDLTSADLSKAVLVGTKVENAHLESATVYGISVWDAEGMPGNQQDLVITAEGEPVVTVDDLKVAQFIYLLLSNPNIRDIIDTIGARGVLILGRFGERKHVLDQLRTRLRELGFAPMVFDFEKPATKTLTETVRVLAGLSAFVVADITHPKSVPQEAMAVIPTFVVPFVPLIQGEQAPWAMLESLWQEHRDRVLPPLRYETVDELIPLLGPSVVEPALELRTALLARKAENMAVRTLAEYRQHLEP